MIQVLLTTFLGLMVMGIAVCVTALVGKLLIIAEESLPARYTTHVDYPVLFVVLVSGLAFAWFVGSVTMKAIEGGLA